MLNLAESNSSQQRQFTSAVNNHEIIYTTFAMAITGLISLFGTVTNVLNIIVFYKHRIKYSITVSYFMLSIWQFGVCLATFLVCLYSYIEQFYRMRRVNMRDEVYTYIGSGRSFVYCLSTCVIMLLSVETCLCVMAPFNVKSLFTKTRSAKFNLALLVLCLVLYFPVWTIISLKSGFYSEFNNTRLSMLISNDTEIFLTIFPNVIIPFLGQVVSIVTAVTLTSYMKSSLKFRQGGAFTSHVKSSLKFRQGGMPDATRTKKENMFVCGKPHSNQTEKHVQNTESIKTNQKYMKTTKAVIWITIQYVICNLPFVITFFAKVLLQDRMKTHSKVFDVCYSTLYLCTVISPGFHCCVYWNTSTKYKQIMRSMLGWGTDNFKSK